MADMEKQKADKANTKANAAPKKASSAKVDATASQATVSGATPLATATPSQGTTNDMKSKVKDEMSNFKTRATDGARTAAEKGKDRATEAVASISKLIRDSAATIDENVGAQYGNYARSAADSVDGFASKIDAKDVDELVGEARDFVRKSPAVAIGAAAAIGFVLARLVRSGRNDA